MTTIMMPWLDVFLAVTVVNLASLACLPITYWLLKKSGSDLVKRFLLSLSVGTLLGEAVIHLIPEHPHAMGLLAGIYTFLLLERFLQLFHSGHGHSHVHGDECLAVVNNNRAASTTCSAIIVNNDSIHEDNCVGEGVGAVESNPILSERKVISESKTEELLDPNSIKTRNHHHHHNHNHNHNHNDHLTVLLLIADGLHNILDGVAMGISFSYSHQLGWTTALAILCHEIPHEISDFTVIYNNAIQQSSSTNQSAGGNGSKYLVRRIVLYFVSLGVFAYFGGFLGLFLVKFMNLVNYDAILAFVAGNFIYVALVDLLPEVQRSQHQDELDHPPVSVLLEEDESTPQPPPPKRTKSLVEHLVVHAGIITGLAIMYLISDGPKEQ